MKIGYGKTRIIWYILFGAAAGVVIFGIHTLLEQATPEYHLWILLVLVPVLAGAMALVARSENALYEKVTHSDAARQRINDLMLATISQRREKQTIEGGFEEEGSPFSFKDPSLATCWKQLDCHKEDCPAYGMEHARCWLVAGTFCRGQVQGQFAQKLGDCRLCEVYKMATADPVDEITETFYAMNYLLSEREEQLEQAYREVQAKSEKLAGLVSLSQAALSSVHLTDLLQNLLEPAAAFVGADLGWVSLEDTSGELLAPRASFGLTPGAATQLVSRMGEGIIGQAFAGRYIAVSEDLTTDSRQTNKYIKSLAVRTLISLPLFSREKPIGMLTLGTLTPHHYTVEEKDSLQVAADRIALAIENARLTGEVGREREQAQFMEAISAEAGSGEGVTGCYDSFVTHASQVIDFNQACLCLWHPETGEIEIVAARTDAARTWFSRGVRLPAAAAAAMQVIESRRPLVREEIEGGEYPTDKLLAEEGIRSAVLFPLLSKGDVVGVMHLGSFEPHAFSREDVDLLEPVTRQLGMVLDNIRVMQEAERSSLIDGVTGLFSHRFFYEMLKREIAVGDRFHRPVSLILIHVNGLKEFNSSHGYGEGDRVLENIAGVLQASVREVDIVARYGGRDFALLLLEVNAVGMFPEEMDAWNVAARVRDQIVDWVFAKKEWADSPLSLSMGIAEYPINAVDATTLLERADWALREARSQGQNEVVMAPAGG